MDNSSVIGRMALLCLPLFALPVQADVCRDYEADIAQIESAGLTGDALIDRLYEIEDATVCPRWKMQMGTALGQLDEWDEATSEFKDARSPEYPVSYAYLANALWQSASAGPQGEWRERTISEASSNGDIAFKLYRTRNETPPDWAITLMRELDDYNASAGADYYAMVLSQSSQDTKGTGVVPGLNVQINFDTDSAVLDATALQKVGEIAEAIQQYLAESPGASFEVIGHTDIVGSEEYNQGLSDRRAESVVTKLKSTINGISVSGYGKGKTELKYPGDNETINRFNRRVEIKMK